MSRRQETVAALAAGIRAGEARALSRGISLLEDGGARGEELIRALEGAPSAYTIGVTGPPGAGKSTLISALVGHARAEDLKVGVVCVDPTSPFSDGALLGDRIRLVPHFLDPGVFIRSMGARGHAGGLGASSRQTLRLLGAAGKDLVLLETVGAGQGEVSVLAAADTVVLVLMPGGGDTIQALKAGIMEIPDLIVVSKADRPGARAAARELRQALGLAGGTPPEVVLTDALAGAGTAELWQLLDRHRREGAPDAGRAARRGASLVAETLAVVAARMRRRLETVLHDDRELAALLDAVRDGRLDPEPAAYAILRRLFPDGDEDDPNPG